MSTFVEYATRSLRNTFRRSAAGVALVCAAGIFATAIAQDNGDDGAEQDECWAADHGYPPGRSRTRTSKGWPADGVTFTSTPQWPTITNAGASYV